MTYSSANMIKGKRSGESRYNDEQTRTLRDGQEEWANPNIDASMSRTHAIRVVFSRNADDIKDAIDSRIAEALGDKRLRKDAVTHLPFFATMPDYSRRSEAERAEFVDRVYGFLEKRFGAENVVDMRWHFDESSPHLHATIVPITEDGRLCAKEMFRATKPGMMRFQRDYYAEVAEPMGYDKPDFGKSKEKNYTKETIATRKQLEQAVEKRDAAEAERAKMNNIAALARQEAAKEVRNLEGLRDDAQQKAAEVDGLRGEVADAVKERDMAKAEAEAAQRRADAILANAKHNAVQIVQEAEEKAQRAAQRAAEAEERATQAEYDASAAEDARDAAEADRDAAMEARNEAIAECDEQLDRLECLRLACDECEPLVVELESAAAAAADLGNAGRGGFCARVGALASRCWKAFRRLDDGIESVGKALAGLNWKLKQWHPPEKSYMERLGEELSERQRAEYQHRRERGVPQPRRAKDLGWPSL